MSIEDDETDGAGTANDPVAAENRDTADDDPAATGEDPPDDPGAPEADTPDDPVSNYWLYVGIGLLTGVIAWLLVPLFGVGTVYAGYELYRGESKFMDAYSMQEDETLTSSPA